MGYTREQIAFLEKYEKQITKLLEEELSNKRRNKNDRLIELYITPIIAIISMAIGIFMYDFYKCKFIFVEFNFIHFIIEISFELAIWGFTFTFAKLVLSKSKYKMYGYFISTAVSFALSYIIIGLFDFQFSDEIDIRTTIYASLSSLLIIIYFIIGLFRGKKIAKERNAIMKEMADEYDNAFTQPHHYNNKLSANKIKKNSRKKNRKK